MLKKKTNKKEFLCKCASSNLEKIQYTPEPEQDKIKLVQNSIDKAKNGLLSLAEDIFLLNNDDNLQGLDLGEKCNSNEQLKRIAKCEGKDNVILSEEIRNKFQKDLYKRLEADSHPTKGHRVYFPAKAPFDKQVGLFDREVLIKNAKDPKLRDCIQDKKLTSKFISDIQAEMLNTDIGFLQELSKKEDFGAKNLNEYLEKAGKKGKNLSKETIFSLENIKIRIKSNPRFEKMANSKTFYQKLISGENSNPVNALIKNYTNDQNIKNEIIEFTQNRCDNLFKGIETALCASNDDALMPVESPKAIKDYLKTGKYGDQNEVANIMETSAILSNKYCPLPAETKSNLGAVKELIDPISHPTIRNTDNFERASQRLYQETNLNIAQAICQDMPPQMDTLISAKDKACKEKGEMSSKCRMLEATIALSKPVMETLEKQVADEVREKAKKSGITDNAKIVEMVTKAIKSIDTPRLMQAYSDYNAVPIEKAKLVNSFLGIKPQITAVAQDASNDVIDTGAGDNGADITSSQETGEIRGASVNSSSVNEISYQDSLPKNKYAREVQQKTKSSLDNFYNEVANRITRVKDDPTRRVPGVAGKTKPRKRGKTAEQKLLDALKPPYEIPESREPANTLAFDDSYDTSENYYETDADSYPITGGSTDNSIATGTPTQKDDYNDALGEKQEANEQDRIARANAGKIKPSPFKKSLAGRSSGASGGGRGPASGGSGDTFLGGGADNSIPIEVDSIQEDIEALIENVYAEKARGLEGENSEHALLLLALLDGSKKKVTLKDPNNENLEVDIVRNENGLKLIPTGNMAYGDPYQVFVSKIEKVIIKQKQTQYNENFDSLLKRLRDALSSKTGEVPPPEKTARYRDYVQN